MGARYLVRFDDICPTMNWDVWEQIEPVIIEMGIKPIVAIVPENRDQLLAVCQPNRDFWARARKWQSLGWTIGWHGYQHLYDSSNAGLVGLNRRSEFAGHPIELQRARLGAANEIFRANDVFPELWVAPGHSFDQLTVKALESFGIHAISDGFFARSVRYHGAVWLPQQLWGFRRMPFGLWTVCLHINEWSADLARTFVSDLKTFRARITSVKEALRLPCPAKSSVDSGFAEVYRRAALIRRAVKRLRAVNHSASDSALSTGSQRKDIERCR